MRTMKALITITTMALLLGACSTKKAHSKKYFRLSATELPSNPVAVKPMTLVIKRPDAMSILGGRPIVATQTDGSLVQLNHNFWLESPKVLLQDRIKQWASVYWTDVSYQLPKQQAHRILDSRILAFEKDHQQAKVTLEFLLYNDDNQLIFERQYNQTLAIQSEGFRAFTQAISDGVDAILMQLNKDLSHVN